MITIDLEQLTGQVCNLAKETGEFIRQERKKFRREQVEKKHAHDYVSYVDKESEKRIVATLSQLRPEAGFIAEEGSGSLTDESLYWVVDPLDGTTNFIHDNPPYCISIALRSRQEILLGVVYEICRDECYWTWKGAASYLNGNPITVSSVAECADAFIALGFPYDSTRYRPVATYLVESLYGHVGGLRLQGAAAAELCYVAAGRFEGRIEAFLGPWDITAGALILQNAGGCLTDFNGGDSWESGHEVVASNGKIHSFLLKTLQNAK